MDELTIKRLEQMPQIKKQGQKKSNLRKLLEKFDAEKMKYAEIPTTKEHTAKGIRIGIGRMLSKDGRADLETFESADGKAVILTRKT